MIKRITFALLLVLTLGIFLGSGIVSAEESFQTYTYSIEGEGLASPAAYKPSATADYLSIMGNAGSFKDLSDIFVGPDNRVYLVDNKASTVYVLSPYYKYLFSISLFYNGYSQDSLNGCKGVFVNDQYIYVCDTMNSRIVVFTLDGEFVRIVSRPQSSLFGADSGYRPVALAVDQYGRFFVVSSSTYQGIIVMTEDGTFTGFIGAQKVTYSLIDIIWRKFQTKEQIATGKQYVSIEYNNITIDDDGFIYVTIVQDDTSKQQAAIESKEADYAPVKKLNSAGDEIMKRNGFFGTGGEVKIAKVGEKSLGPSQIKEVAIGPEYTYSIIDTIRNKVFTYDQNGNLLFAFGDNGIQLGNSASLICMAYQRYGASSVSGEAMYKMLLLDKDTQKITILTSTKYANLLYEALHCENKREYDQAVDAWKSVLARNNNFDAAYIGVGKAYYSKGEYDLAIEYFKSAYDTENYSSSFSEVRKNWISKYIWTLPIIAFVIIFAFVKVNGYAAKVNKVTATKGGKRTFKEEILYSFHLKYHPFDGFWDLKHERRGSVRAALVILAVTILAFYYQSVGTGYLLNPQGEYSTIGVQIISVVIPILLWVISNWCLTTLFDGEGSLRDVFIATCYSLAPLPLILIISTALSNIVTDAESQLVSFLVIIGYIWVGLLLFFGTMVTHDYSMGKNFITVIGTIVGMAIIMFVALLFSSLVGKIISFISNIVTEISYRI